MEGQENAKPFEVPSYLTGSVAGDSFCKKHEAGFFSTCKCENRCGMTYWAERRAVEVECNIGLNSGPVAPLALRSVSHAAKRDERAACELACRTWHDYQRKHAFDGLAYGCP